MKKVKSLKTLLLVFILILFSLGLKAAYINNFPVSVTQPDGKVLNCFLTGDEFYNWMHDAGNFTIVRNPQTGYYCYAVELNDELVASSYIVGKVVPSSVGFQPGVNISSKKMLKIRKEMFDSNLAAIKGKGGSVKSTGIINNLVIFIRFAGENEFSENISVYNDMFNNNAPGGNSLKKYFEEASYSQLNVNSTFYPVPGSTVISYQDYETRDYYEPYDAITNPDGYIDFDDRAEREQTLLANAVNAVSSQIPVGLDLDNNGDGYVDNICFIVSGNPTAWSSLLWPHKWALYLQTVIINGLQVWEYNLQINNHLLSNGVGVLAHEMFHTLGAPDLYHYNHDGYTPVASWDLMEQNRNPPQSMGAYMKYRYGNWISSIPVISAPGSYTLSPITYPANNCYRINSPNSSDEFFIVEYRKQEGVFESSLPGTGLIVYRINGAFDGTGNAQYDGMTVLDEVYIYRPYGTIITNGEPDNANFSTNVGRKKINNTSNPASFLSDGTNGGLDISNVSVAGNTISFDLNGGTVYPVNAGLESMISPVSGCSVLASQPITVQIKNYGSTPITSGLQLTYSVNGGQAVTEPYTGAVIPSGSTTNFTFTQNADFPNQGNYSFVAYTTLASDGNYSNDTLKTTIGKGGLAYTAVNAQNIAGTYSDLGINGTIINTANFDNANSSPINIGFIFYYNCSPFTQFTLNTNGFIKLGNTPPSVDSLFFNTPQTAEGGIFNSADTADVNIISGFNHDLEAGTSAPEYRVFSSGLSPNRVCTIQFKNLRDKTASALSQYDNIEFQIKLYETSSMIEIVYGNWQASSNPSEFKTSAVGLKGQGNKFGQLLVARKSSSLEWFQSVFDNANYSSTATLNFGNPPNRPAPEIGRTFQFNTNELLATTITNQATNITASSVTLNGTVNANNSSATVTFEYGLTTSYGNTINASPVNVNGYFNTSVSAGVSGLSPNTVYHFRTVAANSAGASYGNDMTFSTLGSNIDEISEENLFSISPNPSSGVFNIDVVFISEQKISLKVSNYLGYIILSKTFNINKNMQRLSVDLSDQPAGMYLIILKTEKGSTVKKIIIE